MILGPIRAVATWLDDATYGANAQIANVTLDGDDAAPDPYLSVKDETNDGIVTLSTVPKDEPTPLLLVWQYGELEGEGNVTLATQQDGVLEIAIADIVKTSQAADGDRDAHYRMAAVRKSLNILHLNDHVDDRLRAGVQIRNGGITWRITRPDIVLDGAIVAAGIIVQYNIRELNP